MRLILLAASLLSTVISEELQVEKSRSISSAMGPRLLLDNLFANQELSKRNSKITADTPVGFLRYCVNNWETLRPMEMMLKNCKQQLSLSLNCAKLEKREPRICSMGMCRKNDKWKLQEPLYVEEPGWVEIQKNGHELSSIVQDNEDPFFLTRGKKFEASIKDSRKNNSQNEGEFDKGANLEEFLLKQGYQNLIRKRRNVCRDILWCLEQWKNGRRFVDDVPDNFGFNERSIKTTDYLQPRDKHSDVLDILEEPFFFSRGRRDDGDSGHELDCKKNSNLMHCQFERNLRGGLSDLITKSDPFYVTRGKKKFWDLVASQKRMRFENPLEE